jgi:hypothetical protein
MKLQSKLIATGALALLLAPGAISADEVLIDGFNQHQWINEFGFGGGRNTDPQNGALMRYYDGVSSEGSGSMGYSILGLNEETGWAGVYPNTRDWRAEYGDARDLRFRFVSGSFDVRVDSSNGNRPFAFKLETNGNPDGTPNGFGPVRPPNFGEWFTIAWEVNEGLTINDQEYIPFYYVTRPAIAINYDNAPETPGDPGHSTGDFQVYFDNYIVNGQPFSLFNEKPRGRTYYASRSDFFAYDQPWRSTTGIAVANTEVGNVFLYGPDVDPELYLEHDDEFGPGNETGIAGFFGLPEAPSEGDRYLVLTWSQDTDEGNEGADAGKVGISTNYYSEPLNLLAAAEIKVDVYIPNWGANALPETLTISLVDDDLIVDQQLGNAASATVPNPVAAFDQWTTVTVSMDDFTPVTANAPDLSRIHHVEIALMGPGATNTGETGRVVFDNLRYVEAEVEPEKQEFLVDGFDERQWFNTFGFGGSRNTDPGNGALMRYFQGPDVAKDGNGAMGFSVLGLNEVDGFAGIFPNARENNALFGDQRHTRYRLVDGSFDVKVVSQNGNRPWTFKFETNGATGPNGSAFTGPLNFDEWHTVSWSVNGDLTPDDEGYLFFYYITRAGITLNYGGTSVPEGHNRTTGDFLVYFDNYTINGQYVEGFESKPRGRTQTARQTGGEVSYTQPYRSTTGVQVAATQNSNVFEYGPDVDPPFVVEFDDELDPENPSGTPGFLGLPEPSQGDRYMILTWSADADLIEEVPGPDAGRVGISTNYYSEPVNLLGAEELRLDLYIPDKVHTALPGEVIVTLIDDNVIDGVQLGDAASATLITPVANYNQWTTLTFPMDSFEAVGAQSPDLSRIHHIEIAFVGAGGTGTTETGRILIDNIRYYGTSATTPAEELGDVTGDGIVNVADVTALARAIADNNAPSVEVGDINGDTFVDEADVQALAEAIANGTI